MRTKHKVAVLAEQRLAHDRAEAFHDARALAIELACGEPRFSFDPMMAGVVLKPGESVYRQLPIWIRVQDYGRWSEASSGNVLVSNLRLLCRFASGRLTSLWWSGVVGLQVDLAAEYIVLDYGDGQPVAVSGPFVTHVAMVGIAAVYGMEAMLTHPALDPLRTRVPAPGETYRRK